MPTQHRGATSRAPLIYVRGSQPVIEGGADAYFNQELAKLQQSSESIASFTPQTATAPPKLAQDGTIRLARKPWWPVAGQAADAFVYYDAVGAVWRLLGTAPTST